jgi:tetratricopeptide (TPR) repeat protein
VSTFITGLHPRDESFLMTFDNNPTIRQGFTHQPTKLFDALQNVSIGGGTALTESVTQAAQKMRQASNRKHALILISDGGDIFATRSNLHPFLKQIPEMETLIYSIHMVAANVTNAVTSHARATSTPTLPRNTAAFQPELAAELMESIAKESGGRYFHIDLDDSPTETSRRLNRAFEEIFTELRAQYTIGFYPPARMSSATNLRTVNPDYRVRATPPQIGQPVITDDDPYETALKAAREDEQEGRLTAAIHELEHAAILSDSDPRAFRALGRLYVEEKQFSKAVESLNVLGSLTLLSGADHFILGTALLGLDDVSAALEQLTRSIALTPDNAQAYLALYTADMKLNKTSEALSVLEAYLKRFPNDPKYGELLEQANKLRATLKPLR